MRNVNAGEHNPYHHSCYRLDFNLPSPTLLKSLNGLAHMDYWHPSEHRVITVAECKRIGSFPDAFQFIGTPANVWERIGNSVPPRFMEAIAEHIYTHILSKIAPLECSEVI